MDNLLTFHTETTPDGVDIMYHSDGGMTERVEAVSHIDTVNRLDAGDYDDKPDEGMSVHLTIADGDNQGYFNYTSQHDVVIWRWLIATVFVLEMGEGNGTVSIINDTGSPSGVVVYSDSIITMPLCPVAERLTMTNNTEGMMIERFGIEFGTERATIFYRAMTDAEQGALTPFGREMLVEFHNNFIAESNEDGMPAEPVTY